MKVVNIPSTKMMKKFVRVRARETRCFALRVPIHAIVLKRSVVIASAAKQSIARHNGWMDCFAALAMTLIRCAKTRNARDKPGHDVVFVDSERLNYAWLATVLPSAACAAARRAIGTR